MNQNSSKSSSVCNQNRCYEKYGRKAAITALFTVSTDERRTIVSPQRIYFIYCGMPKGTHAKVALNSKKITPIALAIIELRMLVWRNQSLI